MPANPEELKKFMEAIAWQESRGWKAMGFASQYDTIGDNRGSKYGVARGKYQIMSRIWDDWAREAGYGDANWRDPRAQDAVAAYKMNQYYDRYNGSWPLVAVAWFAGPGAANKAQKAGITSLSHINDSGNKKGSGINVPGYVQNVIAQFGQSGGSTFDPQRFPEADRQGAVQAQQQLTTGLTGQAQPQPVPKSPVRSLAQASINALSRQIQQNPGNEEVRARITTALQRLYGHGESRHVQQAQQMQAHQTATPPPSGGGEVRTTSSREVAEAPPPTPPPTPPTQTGTTGTSGVI